MANNDYQDKNGRKTMTVSEYNAANPNAQWGADTKIAFSHNGKTYALNDQQYDWIKSRYKDSWAGSYGYDVEDQQAKAAGRMSSSVYNSYKNNGIDYQLRELGLPSVGKLESYLGAYDKWHTGTVDQVQGIDDNVWKKISEFYTQDYQYENTAEDQMRKASNLMPKAFAAKYTDTELDESLMMRNLPPVAEFDKYLERYNNFNGIDTLYKNVTAKWTDLRCTTDDNGNYLKNDDNVYVINGEKVKGKDVFAKSFFDELLREDKGARVYASITDLFKNGTADVTQKENEPYDVMRGREVVASGKADAMAEDFANYSAFSYADFESKYGDYFSKYLADVEVLDKDGNKLKYRDGTPVTYASLMANADAAQTEKEENDFYTVDKDKRKDINDNGGVDAFLDRWNLKNPTASPVEMWKQMYEHGIDEKYIKESYNQLRNETKFGSKERKELKAQWNEYKESLPKKEVGGIIGRIQKANRASIAAEFDTPEKLATNMAAFLDGRYDGAMTEESVNAAIDYYVDLGVDGNVINEAIQNMKNKYVASMDNMDEVDPKVLDALNRTIEVSNELSQKDLDESYDAYVRAALENSSDQSVIDGSWDRIDSAVRQVIGDDYGKSIDPETLFNIIKATAELPWSNEVAVREALADHGFTVSGDFNDPMYANEWTKDWDGLDRERFRSMMSDAGFRLIDDVEREKPEGAGVDPSVKLADILSGKVTDAESINKFLWGYSWDSSKSFSENVKGMFGTAKDESYLIYGSKPISGKEYEIALDWMDEMVAEGKLTQFEAYNYLCSRGLQDAIEKYDKADWYESIYKERIAPELWENSSRTNQLYWNGLTDEERQDIVDDMWNDISDEDKAKAIEDYDWRFDNNIHRTTAQTWAEQLMSVAPSVIANIGVGAIGAADWAATLVSGKDDLWDVTKEMQSAAASVAAYGDVEDNVNGALAARITTDAAAEMIKMYALSGVGGQIAGVAGEASSKFGNFMIDMLKTSPFSLVAMGSDFAQAKAEGATNAEAVPYAFVLGTLEGVIESLNVDQIWGRVFGQGKFGKMLLDGGRSFANTRSVLTKAWLASLPIAALGEATEEGLSYVAEGIWKTVAAWNGSEWASQFEWSAEDAAEAMLMGGLTGLLGAGLAKGNITTDSVMYDYWVHNKKLSGDIVDVELAKQYWSYFSDAEKDKFRNGGAKVRSQEDFANMMVQLDNCFRGIEATELTYALLEANENAKVDAVQSEVTKLEAKLKSLNPLDPEDMAEFKKVTLELLEKKGDPNDPNKPSHLRDVKAKRDAALKDAAQTRDTNLANLRSQTATIQDQFNEHYAGIYLRNESSIRSKDYDSIGKNMAVARQNGDNVTPESVREGSSQSVDAGQATGYNNNAVQEVATNGRGNEAAPGGNARVSEQAVAGSNQGVQGSRADGRRNSVLARNDVASWATSNGISVVDMAETPAQQFYDAIGEAKASNPYGAFVTQHKLDEYKGMKTFTNADGSVGVAVKDDGDIVSVFKNTAKSKDKGAVTSILFKALENGGKKLDNFNSPGLSAFYLQHGFVPVARIAFNDEYAPDDWNYERDGRPNILFWVHNGDSVDTIMEKMGTYQMPNVENLPFFDGEDAYEKAAAYRDRLVNENTGWANQQAAAPQTEAEEATPAPETFTTKDAITKAMEWAREKGWKIPQLGFIGKASLAGTNLDLDTLMKHPTIAKAEEKVNSFKQSTFEEFPELTNKKRTEMRLGLVDMLLDKAHGSAVFENGKLKKVNKKGVYDGDIEQGFHAAIVIGPPAAGKSTVFADPLSNRMKARILDSDVVKAELPEFDEGWGAGRVNKESTYITKAAIQRVLTEGDEHFGDNIIIPKVGDDAQSILDLAKQLKDAGYKVDLYLNDVPAATSITRAMARFAKEGRYLSATFLNSIGDGPLNTFKEIANRNDLFDYAEWRDNNVRIDQEPIFKWKTGDGAFPADRTTQGQNGRGSVGEAGQLYEGDVRGGGTERVGGAVSEGAGQNVSGARKTASRFGAAVNGAKLLSDGERTQIVDHVKRVGYKGALSFINDPDQVFDGKIENGNITLNLAYINAKTAQELKDNPGFWVLKHEFTHFIEGTKYYKDFFGAVSSQMVRELGESGYMNAMQAYKDAAAQAGHPFDGNTQAEIDAKVERDMVADYVGSNLFTSQRAIDSFVREQEGAASRIYNWLRYVIDRGKLRRQGNADAVKILEAERMYAQAFRAANKKVQADSGIDYSTPGIDYDLIKSKYGRNEAGDYVGVENKLTGVTAEEDAQYMRLVQEGRLEEAGQMVRDLFERNGWLPGYHAGRRPAGDYTRVKMSEFAGNQYFLARNKDMSQAYTRYKNVRPLNYGNEMQLLTDFVNKINEQYGTDFRVEHNYVDAKTGNYLDGEALENAAPKDVHSLYQLIDNETNLVESDAFTAARLARGIKQRYDGYGVVDNPLEGGILDLYLSPESANVHRGYNQPWAALPTREVEDSFVATEVYLRDLPNGHKELVVEHEGDPGNPSVYEIENNEQMIERAFEDAFGSAEGWNARSAYDVFKQHAREVDRNGEKVLQVNDMYYYPGRGPGEMEYGEYGDDTTDDVGNKDRVQWYDSTIIKNIYDYPGSDGGSKDNPNEKPGDVYIARSPRRIKSADAVTYDNKGNVIPLSLRLNQRVDDLRFSTPGLSWDEMVQRYGAQPQGREPRASDIRVPNRTQPNNRVSRFGRSVMESPHMTNDMRERGAQMMASQDWLSYPPKTDEESMEEARNYIAQRQPLQAQQEFHDMVMQGKFGRKTNAIGLQLLADASNRGDVDSFYSIANDLQIAATEAGQSVQIFNVLKELKGVGSAYYMQRVIERLNTKYDDLIQKGKMSRIAVSPVLMNQLAQAVTVDQIAEAEEAVAKEIGKQIPLSFVDQLSNWRYFSMLANPTTHIRNMTGNALMAAMNSAKDVVAAGIENAMGLDQSQRSHALVSRADKNMWNDWVQNSFEEQRRNLQGGGKLGFETFVKQNTRMFDSKFLNAIAKGTDSGMSDKKGIRGFFENIRNNGAMGMLEVEDAWALEPAYKKALTEYMVARGYTLDEKGRAGKIDAKGNFVEMSNAERSAATEWASQQAWKATFRDASSVATLLNKISKENIVSRMLVEGVMPFKKTPVNIAKRGLEYSPAGIVIGTTQLFTKVKQGKMSAAEAVDNIASGITGSSLMALGVLLAKAGLLRAGGEKEKKYETYLEDTGDQTYSFKLGDYSINMSAIAPATIPLFMGVALEEMLNQNGDSLDLSTITDTVAGTLNPFMEMSFMASLNSALKNYNNEGIGGALGSTVSTAAQNYFSQYLPTFGAKVAQFADPTLRTTKSDATSPLGGNMDYYLRSLAKKVPGATTALQPDVDVWGRTNTKDSFGDWALDFANKFILPTNIKVANRDAVDKELIRVVENTGVTDFLPSDGQKKFTSKKVDYKMDASQYAEYSQQRGQAAYAALKDVMVSQSYIAASDEEKAAMLKKALDAAYKAVNTIWKEKLGVYDN